MLNAQDARKLHYKRSENFDKNLISNCNKDIEIRVREAISKINTEAIVWYPEDNNVIRDCMIQCAEEAGYKVLNVFDDYIYITWKE